MKLWWKFSEEDLFPHTSLSVGNSCYFAAFSASIDSVASISPCCQSPFQSFLLFLSFCLSDLRWHSPPQHHLLIPQDDPDVSAERILPPSAGSAPPPPASRTRHGFELIETAIKHITEVYNQQSLSLLTSLKVMILFQLIPYWSYQSIWGRKVIDAAKCDKIQQKQTQWVNGDDAWSVWLKHQLNLLQRRRDEASDLCGAMTRL